MVNFDIFDADTRTIKVVLEKIDNFGDLSRFTNLEQLVLWDCKFDGLPESLGSLTSLKLLVLLDCGLISLPHSIGNLKNLKFINIIGNNITSLPDSIVELDGMHRIAADLHLSEKLRVLLPNTKIY